MLFKVCCIQDEAELAMAAAAGATHVGLVGAMPSGPGPIPDERIREIASAAPDRVTTVLLTSRVESEAIVDHVRATGVGAVQLVTPVSRTVREAVGRSLPEVQVIQVEHVEAVAEDAAAVHRAVARAVEAAVAADLLLLDSGRPSAPTPEFGGTGRTHDWSVSARIVAAVGVPVLLAGGLDASNVEEAVATVGPAGVDVCSGLRDRRRRLLDSEVNAFGRLVDGMRR